MYPQRAAADYHVGVMGLGEIGGYIASQLAALGYRVSGWARSEKSLAGVRCYHGETQAGEFLGQLDALINVLPLTGETRGILAHPLLQQLPDGASLINCGRGEHMVNQDVLEALDSGKLSGAGAGRLPRRAPAPGGPAVATPAGGDHAAYGLHRADGGDCPPAAGQHPAAAAGAAAEKPGEQTERLLTLRVNGGMSVG